MSLGVRQSREFGTRTILERAHEQAQTLIRADAIKMADFTDIYEREMIIRDQETVRKMDREIEREKADPDDPSNAINRRNAAILEGIIYSEIERSDWFGDKAVTIKTSKYDDYVNGIDLVVEITTEGEPSMLLAIDVTFSHKGLSAKLEKIRQEISTGYLSTIKYFASESNDEKHESKDYVPRVLITLEEKNIVKLAEAWPDKKSIGKHPAQLLFLLEVREQLAASASYAKHMDRARATAILERTLQVIDGILDKKEKEFPEGIGELKRDIMYQRLDGALNLFYR